MIKLNCLCGIVLTASHNPPNYNGYKVYWKDGGQIVPPIDQKLINEINNTNYSSINFKKNEELIELIDNKIPKPVQLKLPQLKKIELPKLKKVE